MIGPQLPPSGLKALPVGSQHSPDEEQEDGAQHSAAGQVPLVPVTAFGHFYRVTMGCGLHNLGNSCYMNSVLQCLAYIPPLCHAVSERKLHGFTCVCPLKRKNVACTACLVEQQLNLQSASSQQHAMAPKAVHTALQLFSKAFVRGRQEDAHEFLLAVLDAVERDSRRGCVALGLPKAVRTLVEQLFCGRLVSAVKCLECGHVSRTYELLTTLSLDLGPKVASVEHSLREFAAVEVLDGANKYKCDKCKQLVRARKWLDVHEEPNVLVVHLKRFNSFMPLTAKVSRHIQFDHKLSLRPPAAATSPPGSKQPQAFYLLTGVVVHSGASLHSGHYYAYVRDSTGTWYCANDSSVYQVSLQHVLAQQAYLLFYSRTAIKPLGPHPDEAAGKKAAGAGAGAGAQAPAEPAARPAAEKNSTPLGHRHHHHHHHHHDHPLHQQQRQHQPQQQQQQQQQLHGSGESAQTMHDELEREQAAARDRLAGHAGGANGSANQRVISMGPAKSKAVLQPKVVLQPKAALANKSLQQQTAAASANGSAKKAPNGNAAQVHNSAHSNGAGGPCTEAMQPAAHRSQAGTSHAHSNGNGVTSRGSMHGVNGAQQAKVATGSTPRSAGVKRSRYDSVPDQPGSELGSALRSVRRKLEEAHRSRPEYMQDMRALIRSALEAKGSLEDVLADPDTRHAARQLASRHCHDAIGSAAQELKQAYQPMSLSEVQESRMLYKE